MLRCRFRTLAFSFASMKALPKRKGNSGLPRTGRYHTARLNESPSEKEGKCVNELRELNIFEASMKALPKRKGNRPAPQRDRLPTRPQ